MPGRRLSIGERDLIQAGLRAEMSCRGIAAELGRSPSTVSREIRRNRGLHGYRSCVAHYHAHQQAGARRHSSWSVTPSSPAAWNVSRGRRWSPEQVAARLRRDHRDDPRWWVSPEAIYRALYVQARGAMRQELQRYLRSGRSRRKPHHDNKRGRLKDMVMIAERPPEVDDRAIPATGKETCSSGPLDIPRSGWSRSEPRASRCCSHFPTTGRHRRCAELWAGRSVSSLLTWRAR